MARSAWTSTARPVAKLTRMDTGEVRGVCIHYTGSSSPLGQSASPAQTIRRLEQERVFHTSAPPQGRGWSDIAYCLPTTVEALTQGGWKTPDRIADSDLIYTLNRETGLGEWQSPSAVSVFSGRRKMLRDAMGTLSTPNHKWPVWRRHTGRYGMVTSEEMTRYHQVPVCAPSAGQPDERKYSDDFVELVAWLWTEGYVHRSRGVPVRSLEITQSHAANPENTESIALLLQRLYGPESPYLRERDRKECPRGHALSEDNIYRRPRSKKGTCRTCWLAQARGSLPSLADPPSRWSRRAGDRKTTFFLNVTISAELLAEAVTTPDLVVRRSFLDRLTSDQLEMFIDVSVQADGHRPGHGGPVLGQKRAAQADAFAYACILAGRGVSYSTAKTPQGRTMHVVRILARKTVMPARGGMDLVDFDGDVWCPTLPNGTWLARDGGRVFFTGNTVAMDVEGRVLDARGIEWRSAANGNATANRRYGAVTWLLGVGDKPTDALVEAFLRWRHDYWLRRYPRAVEVVGHRDLYSTACPGDPIYDLIRSGRLTARPTTARQQEDDDMAMTPQDQAALVRDIARATADEIASIKARYPVRVDEGTGAGELAGGQDIDALPTVIGEIQSEQRRHGETLRQIMARLDEFEAIAGSAEGK